ncbi:MAG TPA: F0F1 ATP synthase subunit gamma, partial [Acidisarcina sp.]
MANVLDLRRRIRSVKNTRQITKAMKMVSAAKLRRAQERAMSSRPYQKMMAGVLNSLKRRIEIYDPITGDIRHPLLLTRPEKNILIVVVSGDKGFAGAFNANILKASFNFLDANGDKQIDVEAIGRKGRDLFRRRYPTAKFPEPVEGAHPDEPRPDRTRAGAIEVTGDHPGMLDKLQYDRVREVA